MTTEETFRRRRREWAEAATGDAYTVVEGQAYPEIHQKGSAERRTHTFTGVGVELMLGRSGQAWDLSVALDDGREALSIEDASCRLMEHYSLHQHDVDLLFGDVHDIQHENAARLAEMLMNMEFHPPEPPQGDSRNAPRLEDVAGYAYYDHRGRIRAVATAHPSGTGIHRCWVVGRDEPLHLADAKPHERIFTECAGGDDDRAPMTTVPIFWTAAMRAAVADRMVQWIKADDGDTAEWAMAHMLSEAVHQTVAGSLGRYPATAFQPRQSLSESAADLVDKEDNSQ